MPDLELLVLGPVEIRRMGRRVGAGGRTTTTLIASLALSPARVISVEKLIDYVWDADVPDHPRAALHNGFSRLRRVLGGDVIECLGWGYRLRPECAELDVLRFEGNMAAARRAATAGRDDEALALLDASLHLWREPLLGNVDSPLLLREAVPRLTECYLDAVEWRAEICLRRGDHARLVGELPAVARAYPLRERLAGDLMIALAAVGRRAEAVIAYQELRNALREELGIDPAVTLQDLHARIMRADVDLAGGDPVPGRWRASNALPFTGSS
jgi:DNA-binding SARP family transcriptional activator